MGKPFRHFTKKLMAMKLIMVLMTAAFLQVRATEAESQTITLSGRNFTLKEVFASLERQTDYVVFYNVALLQHTKPVTVSVKNMPVEDFMKMIMTNQPVYYEVSGKTITIKEKINAEKGVTEQPAPSVATDPVTGKVTDEEGRPLSGATVRVAGTKRSVQTSSTGEFTIEAKSADVLVVSFVGFEEKRIQAGKGSLPVQVKLSVSANNLEEVVAIGYGNARKKDLTGAVSTVKMRDLQNIPVPRVDQMLAGRIAGAEFMSTDGQPGSGASVRIRGTRSITASNEPLYIVDGVMDGINSLNDLNPSDIASISVLKDASSTAIYGSRGANGVIIITTKSGADKGGKTDFTARTNQGFAEMASYLKVMDATQFAQLQNDRFYFTSTANQTKPLEDYPYPDPLSLGKGSDWQRAITRRARFSNYALSASGGNKNTRYYFSGNYDNINAVILNSGMKRYQFRLNLDQTLSKYVKAGVRLNYSNAKQEQPLRYLGAYANWSVNYTMVAPVVPIYNPDGTLNDWNSQQYSGAVFDSPMFEATLRKNTLNDGTLGSMMYMEVQPIKDLLLRSTISYSNYVGSADALVPSTMPSRATTGPATSKSVTRNNNLLNENTITYNHNFGSNHHFNALYGFTIQKQNFNRIALSGTGYYIDETALWDIGSIPNKNNLTVSGSKEMQSRMSHLARINYNYAEKYYLTATLRRDGASNFAANNKWAYFPSAGFRWNVLNENFMKGAKLDEFAFRLSAGTSGNDAIARYQSLDRLSSTTSGYLFGGTQPVAFYPTGLANAGLKWEKTSTYNAGVDLSFFNKRLGVTVDAYKSNTSDLLLTVQLPNQTGFASRLMNFGKTSNKGIELTVNYDVIRKRDFSWSTSFTIAHNKQMVDAIGLVGRVVTNTYTYGAQYMINGYQEGYPLNAVYGFQYAGVWKSQAEIDKNKTDKKYASASAAFLVPGRERYIDQNNDGLLNTDDMVYLGNADPDVYGGLQNTFRYKNVFLSFYLNYSLGGRLYNPAEMFMGTGVYLNNQYSYMTNAWQPVRNPDSDIPRADSKDEIPNDRFVHDASFLRLKAASIGYSFDLSKLTNQKLKSLALSLNGSNLFLLKHYNGFDPEVSTQSSNSALRRIDNGAFPPNRTITFTAELKF
ncbi:SusC/RagA family TonB-linked outer membrane protein [Niastella yeongjuensis]|uniref:SusC/RagA family TonB-linked outer membrane protein n=2 Tax=Niastella yeongjuensis TaxID=354355 RepID=A0A1V9E1S3_9BACT|nr:SusC/RagA family TonB-linked outer membrane protein [Niastella yeongjuensis]